MTHTTIINKEQVYPQEFEQASNSYLMAIVCIIAGLPLPIINVIASLGYYMGQRKASYFVRWHCIQAVIAQIVLFPFNSVAFTWTLLLLIGNDIYAFAHASLFYWLYIIFVLLLNLFEFICTIYTAARVRKGHNVRWPVIAGITDTLCSKEKRDLYKI